MKEAKLLKTDNDGLTFFWGDTPLFDYVAQPTLPANESPKPYFHPLRNLNGQTVSNFRPNDHPWHHGLSMTMTLVNGTNFWGGNTYRKEDGYRMRDNFGTQDHLAWADIQTDATGVRVVENLAWNNERRELTLSEQRTIDARVFPELECWRLRLHLHFENVSGKTLRLGTFESEEGLTGSHYTGIFFRLSRDFFGKGEWEPYGSYLPAGQHGVEHIHGTAAPWMYGVGSHDNADGDTTLIFCDHADNPNYPTRWFFRPEMPCVALPFVGEGATVLAPDEHFRLGYDFIFATGIHDASSCEELIKHCVAAD